MKLKPPKGYKFGKAKPLSKCCREIRICCPNVLGKVIDGFNTNTEELEKVMVIKETKTIPCDMNKIIVVELKKLPETH